MIRTTEDNNDWRPWVSAALLAAFTAIVTAGANAVAEELRARWKAQRESK